MARSRSKPRKSSTESESNNVATTTTTTEGEKKVSALSQDMIQELLAGSRARGAGTEVLESFLNSGEAGIEVDLASGPLAGKEPGKAYTTLVNARKRTRTDESGSTVLANPELGKVRVIKRNNGTADSPDWHVFLVNTDMVNIGNEGE